MTGRDPACHHAQDCWRRRRASWSVAIERDAQTSLYIGYMPRWPGAHSQGETVDELKANLAEVTSMFLEDGGSEGAASCFVTFAANPTH